MATTNSTQTFLGPEFMWPAASLELSDVSGQTGGRRVFVYGTGHAVVQVVAPGRHEQRYEFRLSRNETRRLLQLCLEHDLARIKPNGRSNLPQARWQTITLVNANGWPELVSRWTGVEDARFEAIYTALVALEARTQRLEPTYSGSFDGYYRPNRGLSAVEVYFRKSFDAITSLRPRDIARLFGDVIIILIKNPLWLALVAALFMLAYFWARIEPEQSYGFGGALLHGLFCTQNAVLSLFTGRYLWAPVNTGWGYTAGFMIGATVIPWFIRTALELIIQLARGR
jgi:hypothetical protein